MGATTRTSATANVHDVAAYLLRAVGPMTALKLQKLIYYSQAWSLALRKAPLFKDAIRAWDQGPVVYSVYVKHRNQLNLGVWPYGDADKIVTDDASLLDIVTQMYGHKTPDQLSDLTHREDPWRNTPHGLDDGEIASEEIPRKSMERYYSENRLRIAGEAYQEGRLSLSGAARIFEVPTFDAVALLERHGFNRPIDVIGLSSQERKSINAQLRAKRLRAKSADTSDELVVRSVIATQRIEGVDARPWFKR